VTEEGYKTPENKRSQCDRKSAVVYHTGDKIIKAVKDNRSLTAVDIHKDSSLNHRILSSRTIQPFLDSVGLKARRKRKKVKMMAEHAKERLKFRKILKKRTTSDW
jgi:hypothetical protein